MTVHKLAPPAADIAEMVDDLMNETSVMYLAAMGFEGYSAEPWATQAITHQAAVLHNRTEKLQAVIEGRAPRWVVT